MNQFGLIGYPLSHSFSKKFFTEKFEREALVGYSYENYPIDSIDQIAALIKANPFLKGLNVTIPYKESVLPLLDVVSEPVKEIGACNCIVIKNGRLKGYNTDVIGFGNTLKKKLQAHHTHALILGNGGAAKAVAWVLRQLNIAYKFVSRNAGNSDITIDYSALTETLLKTHTLLVNTTPLGMYPSVNDCPAIPYQYITENHFFFDLIYNPGETLFLKKAKLQGAMIENGAEMLVIQALESWKIWNQAG
jgi:shikimate dehydrogenase